MATFPRQPRFDGGQTDKNPTTREDSGFRHDLDEPGYVKKILLRETKQPLIPHIAVAGVLVLGWLETRRLGLTCLRAWQSIRASSWLLVPGTIESVEVAVSRSGVTENWGTELADAKVAYSYRVGGEYYAGYWAKSFRDEQKAWDFLAEWKGRPVTIRHHPQKTNVSVLRIEDQAGLFSPSH